jgi:transposase
MEHVGRTAADNRQFINGVLWVSRSGARWHDLPERYGKYKSVHKRFMRWAQSGVWERIFEDLIREKKNLYLMIGGGAILSNIAGNGNSAETAVRIAASERFYRVALSMVLIVTLSSILLAYALYVTLKPVNSLLAQLGMIFTLGDSFLALIVRMCSFVRLHLYTSAPGAGAGSIPGELLSDLMRTIAGTALERLASGVQLPPWPPKSLKSYIYLPVLIYYIESKSAKIDILRSS